MMNFSKKSHLQFKAIIHLLMLIFFKNSKQDEFSEDFRVILDRNQEYDLVQFIQEGKSYIKQFTIAHKAIMVLGLSGTGKSTLVNYLNNVPLYCKKIGTKWIVDIENQNDTLPGGFSIGHTAKSKTLYPATFTPTNKDYSYIDNPGFADNRGIGVEIANSAFRNEIIKDVSDLKFLILIKHSDLKDRGEAFRLSMKLFANFLGIFETPNAIAISKSVGFIISRVDKNGFSDEEIKEDMIDVMNEIIDAQIKHKNFKKESSLAFKKILDLRQLEIFSNPNKPVKLDNIQKNRILELIDKLEYIKKTKANILFRISENYYATLSGYSIKKFDSLVEKVDRVIFSHLSDYINSQKILIKNCRQASVVYQQISLVLDMGDRNIDGDVYLNNVNDTILSKIQKEELIFEMNTLKFFLELLPLANRGVIKFQRKWMHDERVKILQEARKTLVNGYFKEKLSNFIRDFENCVFNAIEAKIRKSIYAKELENLEYLILEFSNKAQLQTNLNSFFDQVSNQLLPTHIKNELSFQIEDLISFIDVMQIEDNAKFSNRTWINTKFLRNLILLNNDLRELYTTSVDFTKGIFEYKGHFIYMSNIIFELNKSIYSNVKLVRIFSSKSFIFDVDFVLSNQKYTQDAPDLIIISPNVKFETNINVDLSCDRVPDFIEGAKAKNGILPGEKGEDGKPGEPGYSGGNLIIVSDNIENVHYLKFKSNGGKGGPGQNGGDGKEGKEGIDGDHSKINLKHINNCLIENLYFQKSFPNIEQCNIWAYNLADEIYFFAIENGENGLKGGNAGRGGMGGKYGLPGKMLLIDFEHSKFDEKSSEHCEKCRGRNGFSGIPGFGGLNGKKAVMNIVLKVNLPGWRFEQGYKFQDYNGRYIDGSVDTNKNELGIKSPIVNKKSHKNCLNKYVDYVKRINQKFFDNSFIKSFANLTYF